MKKNDDLARALTDLGRSPSVTAEESEACLAAVSIIASLSQGCRPNCWLLRARRLHEKRRIA